METHPDKLQRNTKQRAAIKELLSRSQEFLTAQQAHVELHKIGSQIGLATVYRTLQALLEVGELDAIRTPEGEIAYRNCSSGHHHHIVCRNCGLTVEISADKVETWTRSVAEKAGFAEIGHSLEIFGICSQCQKL